MKPPSILKSAVANPENLDLAATLTIFDFGMVCRCTYLGACNLTFIVLSLLLELFNHTRHNTKLELGAPKFQNSM